MGKKQQPSPLSETFVAADQLLATEILAGVLASVVARNVESGPCERGKKRPGGKRRAADKRDRFPTMGRQRKPPMIDGLVLGARASYECSEGDGPRPGRDCGAGAMPAAHHVFSLLLALLAYAGISRRKRAELSRALTLVS